MKFYVFDYMSTAKSKFAQFELAGKSTRVAPSHCEDCGARLGPLLGAPPHRYRIEKGDLATPIRTRVLLDEEASGLVACTVTGCDKCRVMSVTKFDRIRVNEDAWQGEDVFLIASITQTMATADLVAFVESHGFTNFRFVDPERYHVDFSISVGPPK